MVHGVAESVGLKLSQLLVHAARISLDVSADNSSDSETRDLEEPFDPEQYWEERHRQNCGFAAVGFIGLGAGFNKWLYRVRRIVLRRALARAGVPVEGSVVLDVGAGTGFYVRTWLELGAAQVTGTDLSDVAVRALRDEFPTAEFIRDDIAEASEAMRSRRYDMVSAFDVLFHIVDDERFVLAIGNIAHITRSGGHLLLSDFFLHGPTIRGRHQVSRSLSEIDEVLQANGFETIVRVPVFFLMNTPIDSSSRVMRLWWRGLSGICRRSHRAGAILGALLFPAEVLLTALAREGPSTELVICRRL